MGKRELTWEYKYSLAKAYYEHHGDLEVPARFRTKNGYEYDKDGVLLGSFIRDLRYLYRIGKLPEYKIVLLEQIGMRLRSYTYDNKWLKMYNLAKAYYEKHNDLNILQCFKTTNGYEYDENGLNLGNWISTQRVAYKRGLLTEERKKLLDKIGMEYVSRYRANSDMKYYELAKNYYEHYGDLEITALFKTKNGIDYDEDGLALGSWLCNQRRFYKENCLSKEKYDLLIAIGMRFEANKYEIMWENKYQLAKIYYEHHGHLDVLRTFKTKNGYEYDKDGVKLGIWIRTQKSLNTNNELSEEKRMLLEKIGMNFSKKNVFNDWLDMFNLAKNYFYYHGNLEVLRTFKTINGYEYDENGVNLGTWISTQRCQYVKGILSQDRINMFDTIGMSWSVRKKKNLIRSWCYENNVDYDKNKEVLERISYQELVSKIMYLLSLNESIVDTSGKLHKIFSMSNINIQAIYGISLEELIKKYYVMNEDKKLQRI